MQLLEGIDKLKYSKLYSFAEDLIMDYATFTFEIKDKGSHLFKNDCLGEVQNIPLKKFADGRVHQQVFVTSFAIIIYFRGK